MKRSGPPNRKHGIRRINSDRRAADYDRAFGPQADRCRLMACMFCGRSPPSDPMHIRSRGARGIGRGNTVPGCRDCHIQQEALGWRRFLLRLASRVRVVLGMSEVWGMAKSIERDVFGEVITE